MSTILETATDVVATLAGHGPQHRYRQSVFDGNYDEGVCFDARRIRSEWEVDRQRYLSRVAASESLATEVPRLQAIAAEATKAVADAENFARLPLPDGLTIGELRARFAAAGAKITSNTPAELAATLQWYVNGMPNGHLGTLKSKAIRSQGAIADCRSRAEQTLYQTAPDVGPDHATLSLQQRCEEIRRRIAARQPTLQAEQHIAQQRTECEAIAAGEAPVPPMQGLTTEGKSEWLRRTYRAARAKLDELCDLVAGKADAEVANARDGEELQRLTAKLAEAHRAALLRLADAKNMRWCE